MKELSARAKINLALVVGPRRPDGKHEVATVLQQIELADGILLAAGLALEVAGFPEDTLVRDALLALAAEAGVDPHWNVTIDKQIPVAAGLGGGSSDAATALRLANETLAEPLAEDRLHEVDGHGEHHHRAAVVADLAKRLQVAELEEGRTVRKRAGCVRERAHSCQFALG